MKKPIYSVILIIESQDYAPSATIIAHYTTRESAENRLAQEFSSAVAEFSAMYGEDEIYIDEDKHIVQANNYQDTSCYEIQECFLNEE